MRTRDLHRPLFVAAGALAGVYGLVSALVARRETEDVDGDARVEVQRSVGGTAKRVADVTGHIGKWYVDVPVTLGVAAVLAARRRPVAALAAAAASGLAAAATGILERAQRHRTPPPGKHDPSAQSYPSGHALHTTTVAGTLAWVLVRERVVPAAVAASAAVLLAVVSGVGRLVLDRHWISDSVGGYTAGLALACGAAGAYELSR